MASVEIQRVLEGCCLVVTGPTEERMWWAGTRWVRDQEPEAQVFESYHEAHEAMAKARECLPEDWG